MKNNLLLKQRNLIITNLAKNLVLARNVRNLTQSDIAKEAGISRATIAQIESGEGDPRLSTITDIASSLDISPVLLLMGKDEIEALEDLVRNHAEESIPKIEIEKMEQLISSGIQKFKLKAAKLGASIYEKRNDPDIGAAAGAGTGAAIGSVLLPGFGTVIGASMGAFFSAKYKSKEDKDVGDDDT